MKKVISILLCLIVALSFSANIGMTKAEALTLYPDAPHHLSEVDPNYYNFELVTEIDTLALYIMEETVSLAILNKKSGAIWSSVISEHDLREDGYYDVAPPSSGQYWENIMTENGVVRKYYDSRFDRFTSLVQIGYIFIDMPSLTESQWYSRRELILLTGQNEIIANDGGFHSVDYASVPNGIRVIFNHGEYDGHIVIDFTLNDEDETFSYYVENRDETKYPEYYDGFEEARYWPSGGKVQANFTVMPCFGAATDRDEGYVFYPDGSGAIAEFNKDHTSSESPVRMMAYSPATLTVSTLLTLREAEQNGIMPVLHPVYGIKKGNEAMFAIITDATALTSITYAPSGNNGNYNRIYHSFYTRAFRLNPANDPSSGSHWYIDGFKEQIYRVEYHFLSDDDANYSGFAKVYRDYLIKHGKLNDAIKDGDDMPLALDIFMNTYTEGIFGNNAIIMTDFNQAADMVEKLNEMGVTDMLINISSWQKEGASNGQITPIYSKLGGANALKNLTDLTNELGFELYMQVNTVKAEDGKTTKFRISRDAAKNHSDLPIITLRGAMMFAPPVMLDRYTDIYLDYFKDLGISGFNYEMLGYFLYDFSYDLTHYNKQETKEYFEVILEESKNDFGHNAVWYGNDYSLKYADWVYDLPSTDTGYPGSTRDVPFAQMVIHGYIPYTSIAGNTFYDDVAQTLKWIEYGYIPYYKLADADTSNLLDTEMDAVFSAKFDDWVNSVVDKYNLFKSEFNSLYSLTIVRHDQVKANVFVTEYSDGTKVYVNYSEFEAVVEGGKKVAPQNYLIVKG